jgi:selenocysteine lyase/cysteine desulfurase
MTSIVSDPRPATPFDDAPGLPQWRADTPGCAHRNHLNNAGAALMPRPVLHAIEEHLALETEIGGYEAAETRVEDTSRAYAAIASLVNAAPRNIAITASSTTAFVRAMSSIDFNPGDVILTSRCDYTSNQLQYLSLARRHGVRVIRADDLPEGGVDPDSVRSLARRARPRLVAISWVPTNSGLVQNVSAVGDVCEDLGLRYLIDACQAIGQIAIDVARLRCDFLSVTARKFLRGPRGIGFLYVSDRALARGDHPLYVDMRGAQWVGPDEMALVDDARRFEEWEFPHALVFGLGAAAEYARAVGAEVAGGRAMALANYLRQRLMTIEGARILDRGRDRCALVTVDIQGHHAEDLVAKLRQRRINASASLAWYGVIDMAEKNATSAVRLSPHYYNTVEEVDAAVEALREITSVRRA